MKKTLSFILSIILIMSVFTGLSTSASAASDAYSTLSTAHTIKVGDVYNGKINSVEKADYHKIVINEPSRLSIDFLGEIKRVYVGLLDSKGNYIEVTSGIENSSSVLPYNQSWDLIAGTYYFYLGEWYNESGTYTLSIDIKSANENFTGDNNSMTKASNINFNVLYNGQIAENDSCDYFKFNMSSSSKADIYYRGNLFRVYFIIYDTKGNEVYRKYICGERDKEITINEYVYLISGTYYVYIGKEYEYTGNYSFKLLQESSGESFAESITTSNNSFDTASEIQLNKKYIGQIASNDASDFYKFKITQPLQLDFRFTGDIALVYYRLYDANHSSIVNNTLNRYSQSFNVFNEKRELNPGTYYLEISKHTTSCGTYELTISDYIETPKAKAVNTINGINVTWNAVEGATKYVVYKRLGTSSTWDIVATTTGTSYADNNTPSAGSYYIYSIKAYNSAGTPSDYVKANCATVQRVVAPVTKAVNVSNGINVTWNKVSGANKYVVLRRIGTESTWKIIGETTSNTYLDKNVNAGIYYIYSIRAVNNTGYSAYDINKRVTIMRILTPVVTATNLVNGVQVKWNAVTGAKKYNVYRRPGGTSTFTYVGTTTGTGFVDKSAKRDGTYYIYSVRAYNGASYSAYIYGNTDTIQPIIAPTAKAVNKSTGVQVSWNKVTGATKYNVYRRLGGTSNWIYVGQTTGTTLLDRSVVDGKSYAYSIRAINGTGYSAYNSSKCAVIKHT